MAMNALENTFESLLTRSNEVLVDKALGEKAMLPLQRMLDFAANNQLKVKGKA
tara:strand:- start:449 stop:607 length:159 start_codon:yes stop_codon:yes gene_type:complete